MKKQILFIIFILLSSGFITETATGESAGPTAEKSLQPAALENLIIAPNPRLANDGDIIIRFDIRRDTFEWAKVEILNIAGQWVRTLDKSEMIIGPHPENSEMWICRGQWDAKNHKSKAVSSGVYLLNVVSADTFLGKKEKAVKLVIIN